MAIAERFVPSFQQVFAAANWGAVVANGLTLHSAAYVGGGNFSYSRSFDEGQTWETPAIIASADDDTLERPLAVSGSFVHVLYTRTNDLYYRRSTDGGNTWEAEVLLHSSTTEFYRGGVVCSGSIVHIVYARIEPSPTWEGQMYYRRSVDNGATMGSETEPYPNDATYTSASRPNISVFDNSVHLAWAALRTGDTVLQDEEINTGRSTDGGVTWDSRVVQKDNSSSFAHRPDVIHAGIGSIALLVWQESSDGGSPSELDLYMKRSIDGGTTWGSTIRMTNLTNASEHAYLAASGNRVALVWAEYVTGTGLLNIMFSDDAGVTWTARKVASTTTIAFAPVSAISVNYLHMFANPSNIVHSRSIWLAPEEPSQTLLDNANRADEGPPPSTSWANGLITFVAGEGVVVSSNNFCRKSSGGYRQGSYYNAATFGPNIDTVAELGGLPDFDADGIGLYGPITTPGDPTTDGYALWLERASSTLYTWRIWRLDNAGVGVDFGGDSFSAPAVGDLIAFTKRSSVIRVWHKPSAGVWVIKNEMIDTTYNAPGFVGLEFVNNQTGKINTLWAQTITLPERQSFYSSRRRAWR
jgi:hypothetical protein